MVDPRLRDLASGHVGEYVVCTTDCMQIIKYRGALKAGQQEPLEIRLPGRRITSYKNEASRTLKRWSGI